MVTKYLCILTKQKDLFQLEESGEISNLNSKPLQVSKYHNFYDSTSTEGVNT